MSDERDTDAAGQGSGGAPVSGPMRPTGKRSRHRTGGTALAERVETDDALTEEFEGLDTDEKKAKKTKAGGGRNPLAFVWNYLRQVIGELRKVIWPNRKQMVNYTLVVLVFLVFMVALIGLVDLGLARLVLLVFGD